MMNFPKISVFILFAGLCSAVACVNVDNTLGSGFVPSNQMMEMKIESFDLPMELACADSIQSGYISSMQLGSVATQTYGPFSAAMAVSFTPAVDSIDWGKDPKFLQMSLGFGLETSFCPSSDQEFIPQNIYIYQLKVPLDSTKVYPNSITEKDYDPTPINAGTIVYTGNGDISTYLTEDFGKKLFEFSMSQLDSTEYFMKHFYGLYIKTDQMEEGTLGGRLNKVDLSASMVYLTYRCTDADGKPAYRTASFALGDKYSVNTYKSSSKKLETRNPEDALYFEGLSGVKPVIRAKALKKMIEDWAKQTNTDLNKVLISRAKIELPFDYNGDRTSLDKYPANLFPCKRALNESIASYVYYEPIDEVDDAVFEAGDMNRSQMNYTTDMGIYLQSLLKKSDSEITAFDDLWLMPTSEETDPSTGAIYYTVNYYDYYIGKLNGTKSNRRPKLTLTYTLINQ
ncbi:MAG: DUF4270 family protein [Bacteroidales bacterium]|nr:DUF4270 family protein [Candidatus Cacconaster equi]